MQSGRGPGSRRPPAVQEEYIVFGAAQAPGTATAGRRRSPARAGACPDEAVVRVRARHRFGGNDGFRARDCPLVPVETVRRNTAQSLQPAVGADAV